MRSDTPQAVPPITPRCVLQVLLITLLFRLIFAIIPLHFILAGFTPVHEDNPVVYARPTTPCIDTFQANFVDPWTRYDVIHYHTIASLGYAKSPPKIAGFHPLFPTLGALLAPLTAGNIPIAFLLLSTLNCAAFLLVLKRYTQEFYDRETAQKVHWLTLCAPPCFILLAPYTEAQFLLWAILCLSAIRKEQWLLAALAAILTTLTRQQGLALFPAMAWAWWLAYRAGRTSWKTAPCLLAVPAAYASFSLYRAIALGDLAAPLHEGNYIQLLKNIVVSPQAFVLVPGQHVDWPWNLYIDAYKLAFLQEKITLCIVVDLLLSGSLLLCIALAWRHMHITEKLYSAGVTFLCLIYYIGTVNPIMSMPRHLILAFPIFILGTQKFTNKRLFLLVCALLMLGNFFCQLLYIHNGWIP